MDEYNGILGKIPAEFVGRAIDQMPDPQTAAVGDTATAVIKVLERGQVRITAVCKRNPRWRNYRYWTPVRADPA